MKTLTSLLTVALLAASSLSAFAADTYKVDPVHSMVVFKINHLGVSNTLGRFNSPAGTFSIDDADPSKSSLNISLQSKDIDTNNSKRDDDLRGPDFLSAKQFPTITFKSTSVKKNADNSYDVTGDLTLHGVTKSVTVKLDKIGEAKDPWGGYRAGYETTLTLKRSDYGITYMPGGVGENVTLMINLEGIKQ